MYYMIIQSASNITIQYTKKLLQKKYREQERKYLVEGEKLIREAIDHSLPIEYVVATEQMANKLPLQSIRTILASDNVVKSCCDTVAQQGAVAVVRIVDKPICSPAGRCLVLDNLQDAGNVGTILRTAVATDYKDVYLINCVDVYSGKVVRSASSAHYVLNLYQGDYDRVCRAINGCQLVCASMDGENIFTTQVNDNHALIIGNEGQGVSARLRDMCHKTISLPMKNNLESLNAGVSAGIIMYQLTIAKEV